MKKTIELTKDEIATLSEGLKQDVISRQEEKLVETPAAVVERHVAISKAKKLYIKLNGQPMVV